jgi:hypothetical protein
LGAQKEIKKTTTFKKYKNKSILHLCLSPPFFLFFPFFYVISTVGYNQSPQSYIALSSRH